MAAQTCVPRREAWPNAQAELSHVANGCEAATSHLTTVLLLKHLQVMVTHVPKDYLQALDAGASWSNVLAKITLPTADKVRKFLDDESADKRDRLIGELLRRPEFVDYWTYKWSDVLLVNGRRLRPAAVKAYYTWIRQQVEANTPWNEFARQIVTARGSSTR